MNHTNSHPSSQQQFDGLAANYAASAVHRSGPSLAVLVDFAKPQPGEFALDVATGTGNAAFAIADSGANVVGIDIATKMLAEAIDRARVEQRENVTFQVGSAEDIPFPDGTFDLVVARHAPHHFLDVDGFLREVNRVLKSGGRFVMADQISPSEEVSDWTNQWQRERDPSHFLQRTVQQWRQIAKGAGLTWVRDTLVPYRMEFAWWVRQSGASAESIERLAALAHAASPEVKNAVRLEFDSEGAVSAFTDQMLVVRLEK